MKLKLVLLFLLTVLIPTGFLVYFSLLAVWGEKEILESNLTQKYRSMAEIILGEIQTDLWKIPASARANPKAVEPLLLEKTRLFEGEVMIFGRDGRAVDGRRIREDFGRPIYVIPAGDLPYEIAVFERYSALSHPITSLEKRIRRHVGIVGLSAMAILLGGVFTLRQLLSFWKMTEIKSEFISRISHDLRGPLTSIRMFSEMLQTGQVPNEEKKEEYYKIISSESEKLTHMAYNLLDFSRLEHGRKKYELKTGDISSLVAETVQRFQSYRSVGMPEHRVTFHGPTNAIPQFPIDEEAISQALLNILFNAAKYSPPGSEIRVEVGGDLKKAVISVIDQGIGIPEKEQKKIFEEYYRGADPDVQHREGSGLGLALAMHAVLAHRGRLWVKSEEGRGSEFTIELPIREG